MRTGRRSRFVERSGMRSRILSCACGQGDHPDEDDLQGVGNSCLECRLVEGAGLLWGSPLLKHESG